MVISVLLSMYLKYNVCNRNTIQTVTTNNNAIATGKIKRSNQTLTLTYLLAFYELPD